MKPSDFLLGLMDFFAILLPGAAATWLVAQYVDPGDTRRFLQMAGNPLPESALWAVFLLASYLLGHFVFMIGSGLDSTYDVWRRRAKPAEADKTFQAAKKLQEQLNAELMGGDFSTLKWAKSYVQIRNSAARLDIDRLEAAQKLFRSFVVIAVVLGAHFLIRERRIGLALSFALLAVVSYQRYVDQRWKWSELTYATAVILGAIKPGSSGEQKAGGGAAKTE